MNKLYEFFQLLASRPEFLKGRRCDNFFPPSRDIYFKENRQKKLMTNRTSLYTFFK